MNIAPQTALQKTLAAIEGNPHTDYKRLVGAYQFDVFVLRIEYVPDLPDLSPARLRIAVPLANAKFPRDVFTPKSREIAARDFLTRQFASQARQLSVSMRGMVGGSIGIEKPGQEILETNAVVLGEKELEARCTLDLPVIRKRIPDGVIMDLFMKRIPALVKRTLTYEGCDGQGLVRWLETTEDADTIRTGLAGHDLAAFIADGSELPKKHPRDRTSIVPTASPASLSVSIDVPNRGTVTGMGIPKGITVLTGGWNQGKTTLLRAIAAGVYNHIPGDGRELSVAASDAVMIRTEESRRIERVDLSAIFPDKTGEQINTVFSAQYASPAASMAANLIEALEIGTSLLLFDDETSAAPLMSGSAPGRALTDNANRPRTLAELLPVLRDDHGVSAIVVSDASELLAVADTVIRMKDFTPADVTAEVNAMQLAVPPRVQSFTLPKKRKPMSRSLQPPKLDRQKPASAPRTSIPYGDDLIDATGLTQLVNRAQGRAIGRAIALVDRLLDGSPSLADAIAKVMERIERVGLDALSNRLMGDLAMFRPQELAAAINRMRQLQIR